MKRVTRFSDNDLFHLKQCLADLNLLAMKLTSPQLSWQDVRSLILPMRKLLLDHGGELQRSWPLVNGSEKLFLIRAKELPENVKHKDILISCGNAGDTQFGALDVNGATISGPTNLLNDQFHEFQFFIDQETEYKDYSIDKYLKTICMSIYGTPISRHDLLKYMANKAGGVHNIPRRENLAFQAIDKFANDKWINGKSLPYLEAQAVAYHINNSESTKLLRKLLNSEFEGSLEWQFI